MSTILQPEKHQALLSELYHLASSSSSLGMSSSDAKKWAGDNLHLFLSADISKLKPLFTELNKLASSSYIGLGMSSSDAKKWAGNNLHLFLSADISKLKPLFTELNKLASSSYIGLGMSSSDAKKWAGNNLHLFLSADISKLKPLFTELNKLASSSYTGLGMSSSDAKKWAGDNLHLFLSADISQLRPLFTELNKLALSSYNGLGMSSSDAKKWAATNLHQFLNTDIQEFKKRFIELRKHSSTETTAVLVGQAMDSARMAGDYNDAIRLFTETLQYDSNNGEIYHNRGMAYSHLERWSEALNDFSRAIALSPHPSSYEQRGMVYYQIGDRASASHDWQQALQMNPRRTLAMLNLGWLAIEERQFSQAIELCSHAILIEPTFAKAYENRARAYLEMGDQIRGLADLQTSHEIVASGRDTSDTDQSEQ